MITYNHRIHSAYLFRPLRSYEEASKEVEAKKDRKTTVFAFTVLLAGSAHAGGNPEDYPAEALRAIHDHAMEQQAPLDTQSIIKDLVEEEVFAKPQIKPDSLSTGIPAGEELAAELSDPLPVTIARVEADDGCNHPFDFLNDWIGGCYELNATLGDEHVLTAEDAPQYETRTRTKTKMKSFRSRHYAKKYAKSKKRKGFDVTVEKVRTKYGKRYKVTATKTKIYRVEIENDNSASGESDGGDTGRERDEHGPESNY